MADTLDEMKKCFDREGLEYDFSQDASGNLWFYPYILTEKSDIRKAKEIVKDFGYSLKLYMPGDRKEDKDAEYNLIKTESQND